MEKINLIPEELRKMELRTPKGTKDFGPEQMAVREKVIGAIVDTFKRHGAVSIDTPVFELKEILTGKYGDEGAKLIFDLADQGGDICSLRYDLTVPFARYLASNKIERMKRYHIAKVYRRDQPVMTKGRYREFYQCDFDIAGSGELMIQEAECLKIVNEILSGLDIGEFEIRVNHRFLLEGMFAESGIPSNSFKTACASVDKLDKQSWLEIREELIKEKGLDASAVDKLGEFVQLREKNKNWSNTDFLNYLSDKFSTQENNPGSLNILKAAEELKVLAEFSEIFGFSRNVVFSPSLARGLDYYTGVIYEVVMKEFSFSPKIQSATNKESSDAKTKDKKSTIKRTDHLQNDEESSGNLGSVAAGGRYDKLVGMFMSGKGKNADVPCVGVSFGIERLFTIMEMKSKALQSNDNSLRVLPTDVYVATVRQSGGDKNMLVKERMRVCSKLWDAGIRAEMSYKANPKLLEQIQNCEKNSIPWMILFGDDEVKQNSVKIRNIATRSEEMVPIDQMTVMLKERLKMD